MSDHPTVDVAAERAAAMRRQEERKERDLYPRLLLSEVDPGASREQLREAAAEKWPGMEAEKQRRVVGHAVRIQEEARAGQRRIDPATIELRHPSERERTMPTTKRLQAFIADLIADEPDIDYGEIHQHCCKRFEDTKISRARTSQLARAIRDGAAGPSENGATPTKPGGDHATPVESPAEAQGSGIAEPAPVAEPVESDAPEPELGEQLTAGEEAVGGRYTTGGSGTFTLARPSRRYVHVNVQDGRARLLVDLDDLPPKLAYQLASQVSRHLAEEAA